MKPDQERVKQMLTETILLLCKNGLHFQKQMTVQGLLGITLDSTDIFMIHLNEVIQPETNSNLCEPDAAEVYPKTATPNKTSSIFQMESPCSEIAIARQDKMSLVSELPGFQKIEGNLDLAKGRLHVKSEPRDHVVITLDNTQELSQSSSWTESYHTVLAPPEESTRLGESIERMVMFDPLPDSRGPNDERLLCGQGSLKAAQYDDDDFQSDFVSHGSRHDLQNPLGINSDNITKIHNLVKSRLSYRPGHKSYTLTNQYPTSNYFVSRYRPKNSTDKEYHCTYPGCTLSFYARRTLLRHQTQKHGRPKSYVRYSSKPYSLPSIQCARSYDTP